MRLPNPEKEVLNQQSPRTFQRRASGGRLVDVALEQATKSFSRGHSGQRGWNIAEQNASAMQSEKCKIIKLALLVRRHGSANLHFL